MLSADRYKNLADEELILMYQKSESLEIIGVLYDRYTSMTYGVCMKYLKDREEAKDAVMQVFEKLIETLKAHQIGQFKGWLYVTARNHCLMQLRSRKGKNFEEISPFLMESETDMHLQEGPEIEANLSKLERCIDRLSGEQKQCVKMFYMEQKCYKEISDATGFDLNQVKSYIQNGKRNLKICMESNE
jgi:RNA polymerase sigma-70 factor (ECF subfamily)